MKFNEIGEDKILAIARMAYHWPDTMADITVKYQPFIEEWYEDAREYWRVCFTGAHTGNRREKFEFTIDAYLSMVLYSCDRVSPHSNQHEIHMLLHKWGLIPKRD